MPSRSLESAKLISEKILQRYVFEKLSESTSSRKALLPKNLHQKAAQFHVLIPEYDLNQPTHRTDFRLFFKDRSSQNIEVEWSASSLSKARKLQRPTTLMQRIHTRSR
jgi:hypothetical protein